MGAIFAIIIGVYWALRILKDAIFIHLVGKMYLPYAKTVSVLALLPMVIFYTKLLEKTSREKMLVILPTFYGISVFVFCGFMLALHGRTGLGPTILGYLWYLFVESFGSLAVALFWAFASDTTEPNSAKRGFPLVVAIGQVGGIICPYAIAGLPHRLGHTTDTLSMLILGTLTLSIVPLVRYFLRATPKDLLQSFTDKDAPKKTKHETGFLEGLKLVLANKYLLAIFSVNFIYELIITIFDFNFKLAAATEYSGVALSNYLSIYGSSVNIVSLMCLLLGISNVTRYLGIGVALAAMPIIVGAALFSFLSIDNLTFLFALMVGSKAINYALNGPALKMLYIPTTVDVRFKAQAWIETFGARASKQVGSVFNMGLSPLQNTYGALLGKAYYLNLSGFLGFPLVLVWFMVALYLARTYRRAIRNEHTVC